MNTLQQKAEQIAQQMTLASAPLDNNKLTPKVVLDAALIAMIVQVIIGIIQVYKACNNSPATAATSMQNGGVMERIALRRVIKEKTGNVSRKLFLAALNVGKTTTEAEVANMYQEVAATPR